jgi:Sec-independent protein secretion pathway component TatC
MIVLYFVGVFVSYAVVRKKRARELAEGGVH